jgi:hypothetical protein
MLPTTPGWNMVNVTTPADAVATMYGFNAVLALIAAIRFDATLVDDVSIFA